MTSGLHDLLKVISRIIYGLQQSIKGLVNAINRGTSTNASYPTLIFSFVRCVEALAFYTILMEQIISKRIASVDDDVLKPRIWDLINKHSKWKEIAGRKNVDKLFRNFAPKAEEAEASVERTPLGPRRDFEVFQATPE